MIERIQSHRLTNEGMRYFVKWKGLSNDDNTWESEKTIGRNSPAITAYWKSLESSSEHKETRANTKPKESHDNKKKPKTRPPTHIAGFFQSNDKNLQVLVKYHNGEEKVYNYKELNDIGYITPGLGDAGDRLFGTK